MTRTRMMRDLVKLILSWLLVLFLACASVPPGDYHDPNMDFSIIQTIAVMPFANLSRDKLAAERVRDALTHSLLATGALYVVPSGEVARGMDRIGIHDPTSPSLEEVTRLASIIRVDALITGTVREYGELRSGTTSANILSLSVHMIETNSQKVVWTATSSKGGIRLQDRLLGSGGKPMNDVTEAAVNEIVKKLFD